MSRLSENVAKTMAVLPAILMTTFMNVIITTVIGMVVYMQLTLVYGWSAGKFTPASLVAILSATAVYLYIWFQPRIRNYISTRSNI